MGALEHLNILVVDDNQPMRAIVKAVLRGFGVRDVLEAADASAGFLALQSTPADLLITDFAMGPVNGCNFTRLIRTAADSPNPYIPIIMLTAYAERTRVEAARDAGVTEFCAKPVTPTELYRKISVAINHPRPFVRTKTYFGPNRRRRIAPFEGHDRREIER